MRQNDGSQGGTVISPHRSGPRLPSSPELRNNGRARRTVQRLPGAGDSAVAGFLAGLAETGSYERAFWMALAAGSASAFSGHLATRAEVEALLGRR